MSRMITPSPGECVDRQTILRLKAEAVDTGEVNTRQEEITREGQRPVSRTVISGASTVDISPFLHEHEEIQRYLETHWFPDFPKVGEQFDTLYDQLAEVNEK